MYFCIQWFGTIITVSCIGYPGTIFPILYPGIDKTQFIKT